MPRDGSCRNAPIDVDGDKVAVQSGTLCRRTIIIDAKPLTQHLRTLLGVLWKESETPWDKPAFAAHRARAEAERAIA